MSAIKRVSATEFKATCLALMDELNQGAWDRVEVTQGGRIVAVLSPAPEPPLASPLHGALRGRVIIPEGLDLTAPVLDGDTDAERGILHR